MVAIWIGGALLLGLAVSRIGLPPLVGFLASGFVFAALGMERAPLLADLAHAGVLLLLFAVGLKLRIKTLLRYEVWGTAISHLAAHRHHRRRRGQRSAAGSLQAWRSRWPSVFGFSSTVLAAKVLDGNRELRAVHGRVAIGILIVQDVVAVVLLAFVNLETPSPYALLLLLRAVRAPGDRLAAAALRPRRALGAVRRRARDRRRRRVRGARIERRARRAAARHDARGSQALAGAHERAVGPQGAVPRRRFSWTSASAARRPGKRCAARCGSSRCCRSQGVDLLPAADRPGAARAHELPHGRKPHDLQRVRADRRRRCRQQRLARDRSGSSSRRSPSRCRSSQLRRSTPTRTSCFVGRARGSSVSSATSAIPTTSRSRSAARRSSSSAWGASARVRTTICARKNENIVGIDSDPAKIESNVREGRRVAYADAEDPSFWHLLNIDRLRAIMLAVPDSQAKVSAARALRKRGYRGLLSATHLYPGGARADHRGRLRRDLQLLHRSRRRFRAPHLRDAAAARKSPRPPRRRQRRRGSSSKRRRRCRERIYKVSSARAPMPRRAALL